MHIPRSSSTTSSSTRRGSPLPRASARVEAEEAEEAEAEVAEVAEVAGAI